MPPRFPPHGNLPGMDPQAMMQKFQQLLNARNNGSALPMPLPYPLNATTAPGVVNPALLAQVTANMGTGLPGGLLTPAGFPPSTMPSMMPSQQHHMNISPQRDSMGSPNGKIPLLLLSNFYEFTVHCKPFNCINCKFHFIHFSR